MPRNDIGLFNEVWAQNGDTAPIADFEEGFGPEYQSTETPDRRNMNDVLAKTTAVCVDVNQYGGALPWNSTITYQPGAHIVGSNNILYQANTANLNKDPLSNPTEWSRVSETLNGVWVVDSSSAVKYSTFALAYAAASTGQTVLLSAGIHDMGNTEFTFDKSVNVIGAGSEATALKYNSSQWTDTAINCTLSGLEITHNPATAADNLMFFSTAESDVLNISMNDVFFNAVDPTTVHCLECSGDGLRLNNVRTLHAGTTTNSGHSFVLKGAKNAVVNNCRSKGGGFDGLLIKGESSKGPCSNISVNNFVAEGGAGVSLGLHVDIAEGVTTEDIYIDGFSYLYEGTPYMVAVRVADSGGTGNNLNFNNCYAKSCQFGYQFGNGDGDNIGIVNANVTNSRTNTTNGAVLLMGGASGHIEVNGLSGTFGGNVPYGVSAYNSGLSASIGNVSMKRADGAHYNLDQIELRSETSTSRPTVSKSTVNFPPVATGVKQPKYRVAEDGGASAIIVVNEDVITLFTDQLAVNDPIWIQGGSNPGVYKLLDFGTVDTVDVPLVGAVVGDTWVELDTALAVVDGDMYPGKAVFQLAEPSSSLKWLFINLRVQAIQYRGINPDSINTGWSTEYTSWRTQNPATGFDAKLSSEEHLGFASSEVLAHTFPMDGVLYAGVFAIADSSNLTYWGWYDGGLLDAEVTNDGSAGIDIKPVLTLP